MWNKQLSSDLPPIGSLSTDSTDFIIVTSALKLQKADIKSYLHWEKAVIFRVSNNWKQGDFHLLTFKTIEQVRKNNNISVFISVEVR